MWPPGNIGASKGIFGFARILKVWDKQLREAELCLVYNTRGRSPIVL
jgi:hypothetical protein